MTFSELSAVKYVICKTDFCTYPREVLYEFIKRNAGLSTRPCSERTLQAIRELWEKVQRIRRRNSTLELASRDFGKVVGNLKLIDMNYDPERSLPAMVDDIIAFLEGELECSPPVRLKLSIVKKYPPPYDRSTGGSAWSLSAFESKLMGIPMGVYMKSDRLFPGSAERTLVHEYAHSVIQDLPNLVTWFDEGLPDFLGYVYYVRKLGNLEDLSALVNGGKEFKRKFGEWYAEYDKLVANLLLSSGLNFVRLLVKLKQTAPEKVDWVRLGRTLSLNPTFDALKGCVNGEVRTERLLSSEYMSVALLLTTPALAYTISPEAYVAFNNILSSGRKTDERDALRGVPRRLQKRVKEELLPDGHGLVYQDGSSLGIYGGSTIGSELLLKSNLVRARILISELEKCL